MTYTYPLAEPPKPRMSSRRKALLGVLVACAMAFCAVGVLAAALGGPGPDSPTPGTVLGSVAAESAPTAAAAPAVNVRPADVKLAIKTTDKKCFGSAGCNVEFEVRPTWPRTAGQCKATYEVKGLDDIQIGTLTLNSDGTYEQDPYQGGSTSNSKVTLTARVTEIECS